MFKVSFVSACPIIAEAHKRLVLTREHVAALAILVEEPTEWALLIHGARDDANGEYIVSHFSAPKQVRSAANVRIKQTALEKDVIGIVHSHHAMGTFFSATDEAETNPRFPLSVVVARSALKHRPLDIKAVGVFPLPCGATGRYSLEVVARDGDEDFVLTVAEKPEVVGAGDCPKFTISKHALRCACGYEERNAPIVKAEGRALAETLKRELDANSEHEPIIRTSYFPLVYSYSRRKRDDYDYE